MPAMAARLRATKEWPVEQLLRDARVLSIYEGTSGMQALDLVKRRLIADPVGFQTFCAMAHQEADQAPDEFRQLFLPALDVFAATAAWLSDPDRSAADLECSATEFLSLAILMAHGWIAIRLVRADDARLARAGAYYLRTLASRVEHRCGEVRLGSARFSALEL